MDQLSVEQALADFAVMLPHVKRQYKAEKVPVIVFGGSYGGMLAAYMRQRYPNLIHGALASSAPVLSISGVAPNNTFFPTVTKVAEEMVPGCAMAMRRSYAAVQDRFDENMFDELTRRFHLCKTLTAAAYPHFLGWLRNAWATMAMVNYPYRANFLGNLPAWPVKVACKKAVETSDPLEGAYFSAALLYNATGDNQCFDIFDEYTYCSDPTGCGVGDDAKAYDYQVCSYMTLSAGTNNVTDMFPPLEWTAAMRDAYCARVWKTSFRKNWLRLNYWADDQKVASRIIYSNGLIDPWHEGGVLKNVTDSVVAITIAHGAHHLDLRSANPADPPSVIAARLQEVAYIKQFLAEARDEL